MKTGSLRLPTKFSHLDNTQLPSFVCCSLTCKPPKAATCIYCSCIVTHDVIYCARDGFVVVNLLDNFEILQNGPHRQESSMRRSSHSDVISLVS